MKSEKYTSDEEQVDKNLSMYLSLEGVASIISTLVTKGQ